MTALKHLVLIFLGAACGLSDKSVAPAQLPSQAAASAPPQFCPAHLIEREITVFPANEVPVRITLPEDLPRSPHLLGTSLDGRAWYVERLERRAGRVGIDRIELKPVSHSVVPGSLGMGEVRSLTVETETGRLLVTGWARSEKTTGTFEIDPAAGTLRVLRAHFEEPISPDGRHVVTRVGKQYNVEDVASGAMQPMKGLTNDAQCFWSPNGQRIACGTIREILVFDANDPSRSRSFGSPSGRPTWSPDSTRLLFSSEKGCSFVPFGSTLWVIDVESGMRTKVASSECKISTGDFGWLDREVAR